MPKTINSSRDQLSAKELKKYNKNKRRAKKLRAKLVDKFKIDCIRVFTEARAGGVCSTKLWGIGKLSKSQHNKVTRYLNKKDIKHKWTERTFFSLSGLRLYVGDK